MEVICIGLYYIEIKFLRQRKQHDSFTKIECLMLFREIITVYSEIHKKPTKTDFQLCEQSTELLIAKAGGVTFIVTTGVKWLRFTSLWRAVKTTVPRLKYFEVKCPTRVT